MDYNIGFLRYPCGCSVAVAYCTLYSKRYAKLLMCYLHKLKPYVIVIILGIGSVILPKNTFAVKKGASKKLPVSVTQYKTDKL